MYIIEEDILCILSLLCLYIYKICEYTDIYIYIYIGSKVIY